MLTVRRLALTLAAFPLAALGQTTVRVSVPTAGGEGNGDSRSPSISPDGQVIAFSSTANNLVVGDSNGVEDVFVFDRTSSLTRRMNLDPTGAEIDRAAVEPVVLVFSVITVAYSSTSDRLVAGDTNYSSDVYWQWRGNPARRLSPLAGWPQANAASGRPVASLGATVAFDSDASNLVNGDTNGARDVFLCSIEGYSVSRLSVSSTLAQANAASEVCALSGDGTHVIFASDATNLVSGDTNGVRDIFSRRFVGQSSTLRASVGTGGLEADGPSTSASCDRTGRWVAFASHASNLDVGDTNGVEDVFVRDTLLGTTRRISVSSNGAQADGASTRPAMSLDGAWVAFFSRASNLVAGDTNGCGDVFLHDVAARITTRVSVDSAGNQGNGESGASRIAISALGPAIAFDSVATNLVAQDTNGARDVFVRSLPAYGGTYCTAGTSSNGCIGTLSASGSPSATAMSGFAIQAHALEAQKQAVLFYGILGSQAQSWGAWSTSYLCVRAPTQRAIEQLTSGTYSLCQGTLHLNWSAFVANHPGALGVPFTAGQHVYAQVWYRDPPAQKSTNFTNALEFVLTP